MGTWLYLGDTNPWKTAWVNCAYCPPQKCCAALVQVGRAGCRGIPVEGMEFVVLHIVEMSFLGFSKLSFGIQVGLESRGRTHCKQDQVSAVARSRQPLPRAVTCTTELLLC